MLLITDAAMLQQEIFLWVRVTWPMGRAVGLQARSWWLTTGLSALAALGLSSLGAPQPCAHPRWSYRGQGEQLQH